MVKFFYLVIKEMTQFCKSIAHDGNHTRNIIFLLTSIFASTDSGMLFNAILLLDIIKKIKILGNVLSIFNENKVALSSTLALFGVLLYIFAFFAFKTFRTHFDPSNDYYCETLQECMMTTVKYGLKNGGGLGDGLTQMEWLENLYWTRYLYDFAFYMVISIVLMNIFFGIIIDSFADKRAKEADIEAEVQGQCFICGISQSKFEIENVPWKEHIFTQHNLHAYYGFIIRVIEKEMNECTGIEKHVKNSLNKGVIVFFPISRCLEINGGETISE